VHLTDSAVVTRHRMQEATRSVPRVSGIDQEIAVPAPEVVIPTDAVGLARIAAAVLAPPNDEPDLDHLDFDLPSVQAAIDELRVRIAEEVTAGFDDLVAHCRRPVRSEEHTSELQSRENL